MSGMAKKKKAEVSPEEHPPLVDLAARKTPLEPFSVGMRNSTSTEKSVLGVVTRGGHYKQILCNLISLY